MSRHVSTIFLRYLILIGLCFWMGGFTFYASVVIHVGHRVFGSGPEFGFLTKEVTVWLTRSGLIVLAILLLNLLLTPKRIARRWFFVASGTFAVMAAIQIALLLLHPRLEPFLDSSNQTIRERPTFHHWHLIDMNLSTVQWSAALIHLWSLLTIWRKTDHLSAAASAST